MPSASKKKWKRTNDIVGHERNFIHKCSSCGHDKMILCDSQIIPASSQPIPGKDNKYFVEDPCNMMSFKCEQCFLTDKFIVDDTKEYIEKILELRDWITVYVPQEEK